MGSNRRFCVRTPPGAPNGSGRITARQFLECSKNTPFPGSRQAMLVIFLHFAIPIGSWFAVPSAHAHAPSPPTPTPFLRFLVWAGPVCCPALSRQNILREKKRREENHPLAAATRSSARRRAPGQCCQCCRHSSSRASKQTTPPDLQHPGQKSALHNFVRFFATESLSPLTAHATSPGLTVKSRRPGPML